MKLFFREAGQGQPMILLHGIFGSSDNWLTQSRSLSSSYHTFSLDLRNHGQSPHDDAFDYPAMVNDIVEFIDTHKLSNPILMGHSMGGKVAMNFAVAYPEQISKLIVVDIAPKAYNMRHDTILEGLQAIPIDEITSRGKADEALARFVEEPGVRQFLLKNLSRTPEGRFTWKLNLPVIAEKIENMGLDLQFEGSFEKPVLFVKGAHSRYVKDSDIERIRQVFPSAKIETVDAGHWVPAERPKECGELVDKW